MKKYFFIPTIALALLFAGCDEKPYIDAPGTNNSNIPDSMPTIADPDPTPDPEGFVLPEGTINVYEAVQIAKKLKSGETTTETYFIKGWVNSFNEEQRAKTDFAKYGNDFAYLSARNDGLSSKLFYCYRIMGPNGAKLPDKEAIVIGDFVVVKCKITNYSGVYKSSGNCWTVASNNEHFNQVFEQDLLPIDTIHATCAEAKAAALALSSGATSRDIYVVEGYVQSAGYDATISSGQQKWFWIDDTKTGGKVLEAYWCNVPNSEAVPVGAKIRLTGNLMNYNGTIAEIKNGDVEILELPEQ
ncbi:MAG: hypothetical protein IK073_02985 [Paludibacteraceae bacterium]|nr:hypothetical protein [Paludibacteraceae bacterium]